jgi:aspartyl-tRNA(Asn)/glutamyl-tRNA(Gln) amidotransferase subunit A
MSVLEKFAEITHDIELPNYPYGPMLGTIMPAEGTTAFRELVDTGRMREMANEVDRVTGYTGMMISAVDYLQAMRARKPARLALDKVLAKFDALVAPTTPTVAPRVAEQFYGYGRHYAGLGKTVSLTSAGNLTGVPAITVPNGFGQDNLPTALQFMGSAWSEKTLIEMAVAYQKATDWHRKRPLIA